MTTSLPLNVFACPLQGTQLIEASAGTGKTWNICGLYLRLVLESKLTVQQILVVTFTNAATAELRERIRDRMAQVLASLQGRGAGDDPFVAGLLDSLRTVHGLADAGMAALLDQALLNFDEAAIFTIHGFSKRALDEAPFAAGMPLALELLTDDRDLQAGVANDFWRRHVAAPGLQPELAAHLLEQKDSPERFTRLLARHAGKPLSRTLWPEGCEGEVGEIDTAQLQALHTAARALWQAERSAILACVKVALVNLNGVTYKDKALEQSGVEWDALLASAQPGARPEAKGKAQLLRRSTLDSKIKAGKAPCGPHPFFLAADALLQEHERMAAALATARLRLLRQLVEQGPAQLREIKREHRVVAFDDMLFNLHERLTSGTSPWLAQALRQRYPAALIDEFQDTDPLQFAIFNTVYSAPESLLFLVGDPKQAIYSFRNADLQTYLRARGTAQAEYSLAENQRSTQPLLTALNSLFGANPQAFMLEGLAYQPVNAGSKPRSALLDSSQPRAPLQLWALPEGLEGKPPAKGQALRAATQACAAEIARLLAAGLAGEVTLDGKPFSAGDIAVLVRRHADGREMRRALAALGVGSVELSQASVYETADAQELERVLAAILEPGRERLVRAALATELMGLDATALEALATDERRMLAYMARFGEYRDRWLRLGVGPMLRELMVNEQVNLRMLARTDGERRLTNLRHLAECLHEAAAAHNAPEALLRWLQEQRSGAGSDEATQLRLESDRNLVQIVTIYKAKGLEYPFVFCPFLWNGHPGGGPNDLPGREYHDEAGQPVIDYRPADDPAIKQKIDLEKAAESLRLIYVALTRAVHRCYVVVGAYMSGNSLKEATRAPLNWLVAGKGATPAQWMEQALAPAQIDTAWAALAKAHPECIGHAPLPPGMGVPVVLPGPHPESLAARDAPAFIPAAWRIGSYSSLAHGARSETAAADHDVRNLPAATAPSAEQSGVPADDILHFPRGARAGECLHAVFEGVDFTSAAEWPAAIAQAFRSRPPEAGAADLAQQTVRVQHMLADVLDTPLPGGFTLSQVPRSRRLVELEFSLPAQGLEAGELAAALRRHGYPVPALAFGKLQGYLRGFIDLVFEHGGRFHVLDWKSNHLGWSAAAYGPGPLRRAMEEQGYHLQYLLYAVALHRWLGRRLAGYNYETHFGGVLYLFVRGVRPAWKAEDGSAAGVFFHKPSLAVIEEIDALLGATAGAMG